MKEFKSERGLLEGNFEVAKEGAMKIAAWIESHPGRFSINDLSNQMEVSRPFCRRIVEAHPLVRMVEGPMAKVSPLKRYVSMAVVPPPTEAGELEIRMLTEKERDKLGKEARKDFFKLIEERSLLLHQGKRRLSY